MTEFVHLNLHTDYSLADSLIRVEAVAGAVAAAGMPAVALTDQSSLSAMVKFYKAALKAGVKPLIGADVWIENPANLHAPFRLLLLCRNSDGYRALSRLLSRAHLEAQHHGRACVRRSWLAGEGADLIALSGAQDGELGAVLRGRVTDAAARLAREYRDVFGDRFYLELQRIGRPDEEDYIAGALELAQREALPVVATNAVRFLHREDFEMHEVRVCVHEGRVLDDARRPRRYTREQYLRTPQEMADRFADIPEAIANAAAIARRCNFRMRLDDYHLPRFPLPEGVEEAERLRAQAWEGLRRRLAGREPPEAYAARLQYEIGVIEAMGFPGYFLIVADFIRWAKSHDIPVGPGRGSGAGSLVAWALGITELDPIEQGLLFERFLNPERVSLPDFDVDFCMDRRDEVIEYVADRYGRDRVAQIITHGTMAARAAVRDAGRVLGMPYGYVDRIAKLVPFMPGKDVTLDDALGKSKKAGEEPERASPDLQAEYQNREEIRTLIDTARAIEGLARNAGKHAGGVVIAPQVLTEYTPLYCEQGGTQAVTQLDKDDLEKIGLVKFDFLGLRTLTILDRAAKSINRERTARGEAPVDILKLPLDDAATYEMLCAQRTAAVFQFESRGMRDLLRQAQPRRFEDLIALVALYRPGPMELIPDFIAHKHGQRRVEYLDPRLEPILSSTYGVMIYQEQVMEIARQLAGYTMGAADLLRRAMGKKDRDVMAEQREGFLRGARERGIPAEIADRIFDLIEKFAGYGFNKSHAAAYALIAYQTAWLKAHYPARFMAATLSAEMTDTDKVVALIWSCRELGVEVLPPDVNSCHYGFEAVDEKRVRYGLGAIKGLGQSVIDMIVAARGAQPFRDLYELCERLGGARVNRRALEALIKSGALDGFGAERAQLMAQLPEAVSAAERKSHDRLAGQTGLFEVADVPGIAKPVRAAASWTPAQKLAAEKETLGLYLSGHPVDACRTDLEQIVDAGLSDLQVQEEKVVVVAGLVVGLRVQPTRKGNRMAYVTLDDGTGRAEIIVFPETFLAQRDLIQKDAVLIVQGLASADEYTGGYKVTAERLLDLAGLRLHFAHTLIVELAGDRLNARTLPDLEDLLRRHAGGKCALRFRYRNGDAHAWLATAKEWTVKPDAALISELARRVGEEHISFVYKTIEAPARPRFRRPPRRDVMSES